MSTTLSEKLERIDTAVDRIRVKTDLPDATIEDVATAVENMEVINNQDMDITINGTYSAEEGYTGLGTINVNIEENYYEFIMDGNYQVIDNDMYPEEKEYNLNTAKKLVKDYIVDDKKIKNSDIVFYCDRGSQQFNKSVPFEIMKEPSNDSIYISYFIDSNSTSDRRLNLKYDDYKKLSIDYQIDEDTNDISITGFGTLSFSDNAIYRFNMPPIPTDNTTAYTPTGDYNPATKKYVDDKTNTLYFEGTSNEWKTLTPEEQDSFLVSIVEPMAETGAHEEETFQAIFLDETSTETEADLTEDEAITQLDRIIDGETI